jgi:Xaa-Pro aminopeptidase
MIEPDRQARVERLLSLLPSGSGALACDPANVRWLTGLAGEPHQLYGMAPLSVVVGPTGELRVVVPASELAWIEEEMGLDQVLAHGSFVLRGRPTAQLKNAACAGDTPAQALAKALAEVGADGELLLDDGASATAAEQTRRDLEPHRLRIDRAPWLRARSVKDDLEIAALRRVNLVAEAGIVNALERAEVGVSERDLLRWVQMTMVEHGARPLLGSIGIAERGALVDFAPSERPLSEGEAIRLDVGCVLDGYHADLARTAVLGEPPSWLSETHTALLAGQRAALAALRPGVSGAELFARAIDAARAAGLEDYQRSHCGHGIGLNMYEPPLIRPDSHEPIALGATCCVEAPLYMIGQAGVQVEDAVVVTETGSERLGTLPQGLLAAGLHIPLAEE